MQRLTVDMLESKALLPVMHALADLTSPRDVVYRAQHKKSEETGQNVSRRTVPRPSMSAVMAELVDIAD